MKYHSKHDLLESITTEHDALRELLRDIPKARQTETGVWGDEWTVRDLIAHLAEWHLMFLRWFEEGQQGGTPAMPAPGFKWNETPRLNREIWEKHRRRSFRVVEAEFTTTYEEIVSLLVGLSEAEIFEPGRFEWTGKNALVTYVGANTASHYRFALKVLKRWQRGTIPAASPSGDGRVIERSR